MGKLRRFVGDAMVEVGEAGLWPEAPSAARKRAPETEPPFPLPPKQRLASEVSDALPLMIQTKAGRVEPYTPNPIQQTFLDTRSGRDLILKARQVGISTAIQADYFKTALTQSRWW